MKKPTVIFSLMLAFLLRGQAYSFTSLYVGWEEFINPALPVNSSGHSVGFGILGTTPTRVYFLYNILGRFVLSSGESTGNLGWGMDLAAGIGYRFLNPAYKRSGWDVGIDLYASFIPYFLNSETGYTSTVLYYGVGLGLNSVYKINPYIGVGLRAGMKYLIGTSDLSAKTASINGLTFQIGGLLTF